jgi:uncharacterized protein
MLIRFVVKNLFSFKEETEFNLLPGKTKRLGHHKYESNGIEVLKLTALYGANGSGKSNLIKAISLLQVMLLGGTMPMQLHTQKFKLSASNALEPVELGIEFFVNNVMHYYSISINDGIIVDEYFCSNDEKQQDKLIFHRKHSEGKIAIQFFENFEKNSKELKKVIEKDLLKPNQPLFTLLNTISNDAFSEIKAAYEWLRDSLVLIYPETKPKGLVMEFEFDEKFRAFANEVVCSFQTGISNLRVESKDIEDILGKDHQKEIEDIKAELKINPEIKFSLLSNEISDDDIAFVIENGKVVSKRLVFEHKDDKNENVVLDFEEMSDGTIRLLEYALVLHSVINSHSTFIIDEIERSIHPLIIKELIEKFSKDETTKGQLIFSTHESNLLDQDIFRPDEIWFAEKNTMGSTTLHSLSDYKEHNTIDIRKGYLTGRYGAIPFLGSLKNLNWNKFHHEEK